MPDFKLKDGTGVERTLQDILKNGPALVVFYPGDFTAVCTKQLCDYRDNITSFSKYGLQVVGISHDSPETHAKFAQEYTFPFILLSDPGNQVAREWGCSSRFMLGAVSRACFVVGRDGEILYRHVEPTALTRRKADELASALAQLRAENRL